jgi:SAM-dependent methyltransferase
MTRAEKSKSRRYRSAQAANRRYFRLAYSTGRHGWAVEGPDPFAVKFLKRLKRLAPRGRLLDVGCGEGRHAVAAARLGFKVSAVDAEPLAIRRARKFAGKLRVRAIDFHAANVFDLPFPDDTFDAVLDWGCLHHQKKSAWGLYKADILRVLKPGGFYALQVFGPRFHLFHGSRRPWHIARGAYRRYFTRRDFQELFGKDFEFMLLAQGRGPRAEFLHALMRRRG